MLPKSGGAFIDEIWSIDVVQHGDSGLINEGKVGIICQLQLHKLILSTGPDENFLLF